MGSYSEYLRSVLDEKNMSQSEFARKLGVQPQQVSRWLNTDTIPRQEMRDKMSEVIGVQLETPESLEFSAIYEGLENVNSIETIPLHFVDFHDKVIDVLEIAMNEDDTKMKDELYDYIDDWIISLLKIRKIGSDVRNNKS